MLSLVCVSFIAIVVDCAKNLAQISRPSQYQVPTSYRNLDQLSRNTTRNSSQQLSYQEAVKVLELPAPGLNKSKANQIYMTGHCQLA